MRKFLSKIANPSTLIFNIAFPLLIACLLFLSIYAVNSVREMRRLIFSNITTAHIHWRIMQLENSISIAARMAIITGDKNWIQRYYLYYSQLQMQLALENDGPSKKRIDADFQNVALYLQQIDQLQRQAIHFLQQNNVIASRSILFSKPYEIASLNLLNAIDAHNESFGTEVYSHLPKQIQSMRDTIFYLISSLFLLLLIWALVYKNMRRLKKSDQDNRRLEELLYYSRLNELNVTQEESSILQPLLAEMQNDRSAFIARLKEALTQEEFVIYYQPIVDANTGQVVGAESLIRWQHPDHGLLLPNAFLPLLEATEMIVPIGTWVFQKTCEQVKQWQRMGYSKIWFAVNFSTCQINHPGFFDMISQTILANGISATSIHIEITESLLLHNSDKTVKLLNQLHNLGLHLSLDDFGTGHSSLRYLKQFPFSSLKIDRSFIADITTNITSMAIVETTIAFGKNLGMTLIAEGVEEQGQLHLLKKMNCHFIQGFLFSKAIPATDFTQLLQTKNALQHRQNLLIEDPARYRYEVMQAEHFLQAVNLISHTFCDYEPMTKYLGITYNDFLLFAQSMVKKAIQDGLSIVALDGDTVCACTIAEDMACPLNLNIEIDSRFNIIFSLLEQLSGPFFKEKNIGRNHVVHLFITAVDRKYHGQGLSIKVNFESINHAKNKGYDFMCCEFTHAYNEEGTVKNLKNNRILIKSCNYRDFVFENTRPFEHLDGSASAYIWELKEGAKLDSRIT